MQQRVAYIDNIKGVLIILVVIGHFYGRVMEYSGSNLTFTIFNFIYTFHMPLFLFCSGLFAASSFKKGRGFQAQNVLLYVILYLFFFTAAWVEGLFLHNSGSYNPFYVSGGSWYLLVLALLSLMTPALDRLKFGWAMGLSILLSVASGVFNNDPTFLSSSRFFTYLPFYALGYYITSSKLIEWNAKLALPENAARTRALRIGSVIVLAALFVALYLMPYDSAVFVRRLSTGLHPFYKFDNLYEVPILLMVVIRVVHYAFTVAVCVMVCLLIPEKRSPLTVVGERTLQIYIVHLLFLYWWETTPIDPTLLAITPWYAVFGPVVFGLLTTVILTLPPWPNNWVKSLKKLCTKPFVS